MKTKCDCDHLESENERLQEEVRGYERERSDRYERERREREQRIRESHPSNILYNGNTAGFLHAMDLVTSQCESELATFQDRDLPEYQRYYDSLNAMKVAAEKAAQMYREEVQQAERRFFERLKAEPDSDLALFGDCALSRDYSRLAI